MAYGTLNVDKINGIGNASVNDFRLTLTTGTPVTTADVSAAGTIYMTPYKGKSIGCYDGTNWQLVQTTELSVAASTSASKVFDIFLDYNAGTPQLVTTDWTNDTTRATALTYQDGVLVQTGNTDWRYLGTARTKTASQVDDTEAFRHLWNYYNRVDKNMQAVLEATASWTYNTATTRQANGNVANMLDFVIGVNETMVEATVFASFNNNTAGQGGHVYAALDTTSANTGSLSQPSVIAESNVEWSSLVSGYVGMPSIGRHFISWNERGTGSGTQTWYGDNNSPSTQQAGISGRIKC